MEVSILKMDIMISHMFETVYPFKGNLKMLRIFTSLDSEYQFIGFLHVVVNKSQTQVLYLNLTS